MTDWDRLVREHGSMVFTTAWRILGHAPDAEDVVQEVFLEVHRLWTNRTVRHWPGFLHRLAVCRALDSLRQRKPCQPLNGLALASRLEGPEAAAIGHELSDRLREAIAQLPTQEGAVFCLRYYDGLTYQQIADSLDISRGGVAATLHQARTRLESLLTEAATGE